VTEYVAGVLKEEMKGFKEKIERIKNTN
jgi:hypothetical protein